MPKGYSNKTGLPHKMPQGNVFERGNILGKESFKGKKHTQESKEKMSKYQKESGGKNPHRFKDGHVAYNKTGETKHEIQKRADKKWRLAHPERVKEFNRKQNLRKYGLTISDFDAMLEKQNGKCAVCGRPPENKHNVLFVDHDHKTGKIRALLCYRCNCALGMVQDNPDILGRLVEYLMKHA